MAGQGAEGDKKNSGAGHWNMGPDSIYKFHRRNESSKPWRSRYTPRWKSLYKDWARRLGCRRGTIYSNAASQLDHRRATLSRSSVRMAPESNLEAKYAKWQLNTNFKAEISPSRAGAPMHADALDAQMNYTREHHNSGGGRTEETRDRVNQQQIDRSRISNRTRARGTEIAAGTTSADGWTTFPAKRQVAAIEMRVGQNGGPLPSEAIIDLGAPIINNLPEVAAKLTATVRDASALKSQHESVQFRNRRTLRRFLQQNGVYSGHVSQLRAFCATAFTQTRRRTRWGCGAERSCGWDGQCATRIEANPTESYAFGQRVFGRARPRWRRRGTK